MNWNGNAVEFDYDFFWREKETQRYLKEYENGKNPLPKGDLSISNNSF